MTAAPASAPLSVSMGDPAGIGLDITLIAWRDRAHTGLPPFALYAPPDTVTARARQLGIAVELEPVATAQAAVHAFPFRLPLRPIAMQGTVTPGSPAVSSASTILQSIDLAVEAVVAGEAAAVVTNPIAKALLYEAGFRHPGHTEYLAELASRHYRGRQFHPVMMLACDELRVVPLTVHIPLQSVPQAVTRSLIFETLRVTYDALKRDFGIASPRIAVCGLNPHAGEGGSIGREDIDVIAPAIAELRAEGLSVTGPHSADTLFHAAARATYDAAVCMYHDQALIPIKTLAFDRGVNVTLGLPFVRTSPDHGTAFSLAGRGKALADSFVASCKLAQSLGTRRRAVAAAQAPA